MQQQTVGRFTEGQLRRYESIIEAAVYILPSQYTVETPWMGFAQATVSRNLREAIQALRAHPEWETSVNRTKFNQYFPMLEVAEGPNMVIMRLRTRGQRGDAPTEDVRCPNILSCTKPLTDPAVAVLVGLVSDGYLQGLRLASSGRTTEELQRMANNYNVAVLADGDAIVIL